MIETLAEREERKAMYLTYVRSKSHGVENLDEVLKEASTKWEKENNTSLNK